LCPAFIRADERPLVYVIDMDRVVNESIVGKAARSNIEDLVRKSEGKLSLQRMEIERMQADIEKQASLLAPAAMEEKREATARRAREFERAVQDQREEVSKQHNAEMKKVVEEIDKAVRELSSRGSYPLIIEKDPRVVVYSSERADLTNQVVAMVDAQRLGK
jgi:Skp family chaperone for outer membrane proteins